MWDDPKESGAKASLIYSETWRIGPLLSNAWQRSRSRSPMESAILLSNGTLSLNSNAATDPRIMRGICLPALKYCKRLAKIPGANF